MSKSAAAHARSEFWFGQFLAMGKDRSLRKLATEAQRICNETGEGKRPASGP
jgi:hypothetical protein